MLSENNEKSKEVQLLKLSEDEGYFHFVTDYRKNQIITLSNLNISIWDYNAKRLKILKNFTNFDSTSEIFINESSDIIFVSRLE